MKSFYNRLSRKTSAELMVWSFLVASFVGGTALYVSEYNREVVDMVPVIQQVTQVDPISNESKTISIVTTKEVTKQ